MGTNYYLIEAGGEGRPRHIGKSSAGWVFALHVYPNEGISSIHNWMSLMCSAGSHIEDEYGRVRTRKEMLATILDRGRPSHHPYFDDPAYLSRNHAVVGPNNLLRSRIDGVRVVGHGGGTYDYHIGEFS